MRALGKSIVIRGMRVYQGQMANLHPHISAKIRQLAS
jgi:hypothetical protein